MPEGLSSAESEQPTREQLCSSIDEAISLFSEEDPVSQQYLEEVMLPELSEALGKELNVSSNTLGYLHDKRNELNGV